MQSKHYATPQLFVIQTETEMLYSHMRNPHLDYKCYGEQKPLKCHTKFQNTTTKNTDLKFL